MASILGEADPGFNLWTSAHGFHHISLTQSKFWKCFWIVLVTILSISLVCCIIYYFYFVFSFSVYSRFILDSPTQMDWPTTLICDRQLFSFSKLSTVQPLTNSHASLLSWSVDPSLARPDVMNQTRVAQMTSDINTALTRSDFNRLNYNTVGGGTVAGGPMDQLLKAIAPNCSQLILQCVIGNTTMNGFDCCTKIFDPNPYFTAQGTCFSTRGAPYRPQIMVAGDASSMTITTMHDPGNTFDPLYASPRIYGANGLAFAIVDDNVTVAAAMAGRAQSVLPGTYASVGLSRTVIDNRDLRYSAIGKSSCVTPGEREPRYVDADLNYGIDFRYGYSRDACTMQSKMEMLTRELLSCTFTPLTGDNMQRCNANQSVAYYRSFIDANATATPDIPIFYIDNKSGLRTRYNKVCPADCMLDRYTVTASYSTLPDALKQTLQTTITSSGQVIQGSNPNVVVLKLYMGSMEYQRIYNFPQPGLQFVAEIGGLMAFLLGLSVVSIIECLCYCCCCGCCKQSDDKDQ